MLAAIMICGASVFTACTTEEDNPVQPTQPTVIPAQLKQGIWTEYDSALEGSGKYTEEQLAQLPAVGMWIEGDKGYFFTYTAEDASEPVEGKVNYDNKTGKGNITFPAIQDSPLSNQTVDFSMTSDETMQFEITYEGQKVTCSCAWLCENLDNWFSEITDEDWLALMALYQLIAADAGPDATIDWSSSEEVEVTDEEGNTVKVEVAGLDEPLVWDDETAAARPVTRFADPFTMMEMGSQILDVLFGMDEKLDSMNEKLDVIVGKLDQVLENQQKMMEKLEDIDKRLIAIAQKMKQQATVDIFNDRNKTFYNPLDVQNTQYFDSAFKLYNANKNDLNKVSAKLGEYALYWAGNTDRKYIDLTWQYIKYLTTVQHSTYGTGMDKIYDGLTFEKYPWEHLGTGDRLNYRAYDLSMITKCLFMISLYTRYYVTNETEKEGIYNIYKSYKPKLQAFNKFEVANPNEFRVCQIPGAHFVMRKEIQEYNYYGENGEAPSPSIYGQDAVFMPRWHKAGSVKIENPAELKSKLMRIQEMSAINNYYNDDPQNQAMSFWNLLTEGENTSGAVYANGIKWGVQKELVLYNHTNPSKNGVIIDRKYGTDNLRMYSLMSRGVPDDEPMTLGIISGDKWQGDLRNTPKDWQIFMAIIEKRF